MARRKKTYETESPEDAVVDQEPSLFAKPGDVLPLGNALGLCVRREQVFQRGGAEAGKENDAEEDEEAVILAEAILSGRWVVVREREVLSGMGAGARHTSMGEEEEGKEVESEACMEEKSVLCVLTRECLCSSREMFTYRSDSQRTSASAVSEGPLPSS